jgi:flagellar basal-body rod modification protein FlgD
MAIQPTTTTTTTSATTATTSTPATTAKDKSAMGKDDFLKLLVGQLKNQDPQNPTGSEDFMGQMAQFSMLEQLTNLATATTELTATMNETHTVGLLGHQVTYLDAEKKQVTGTVESVNVGGKTPTITVGGTAGIDPTKVSDVR